MIRPDRSRAPEPTRVTPYELAFSEAGFEDRYFAPLEEEAEHAGLDTTRHELFGFLSGTQRVLAEITPPEAAPEAREQHRALLFHAFNFWRAGKPLYFLDAAVARYLVEAQPRLAGWELVLPQRSLYLQLPANLFWASIAPDTPPEPVDGFFLTACDGTDALGEPFRHLDALMVLGMRRRRAGFSVIAFETEIGPGIAAEWAETAGRAGGREFENLLPGGEIAGLYSILTTTEALKLLARALWYIDTHPAEVVREEPAERRASDRPDAVRYSRLPFHRVTLRQPPEPATGA